MSKAKGKGMREDLMALRRAAVIDYVIEKLCDDAKKFHFQSHESLRMLQAWRAKTFMQIVINRAN